MNRHMLNRKRHSPSVLLVCTLGLIGSPAFAQQSEPPVHSCDRLAASPSDRNRKADGVPFDAIQTITAIISCRAAVRDHPNTTRFQFQLARALDRSQANEKEAFDLYLKAAEAGHPGAMNNVGSMFQNGRGVAKDEAEAQRWYRRAAEAGSAAAAAFLKGTPAVAAPSVSQVHDCDRLAASPTDRDRKADGVPYDKIDVAKAVAACRAALRDHPNTTRFQFQLARALDRSKESEKETFDLYRKAAEAGHPGAMNNLGSMFQNGRGVAQNDAEAIRWYRRSAELGQREAMSNLALMYANGRGVAANDAEAAHWYRKAAEAGDVQAMLAIARMYASGRGVARNEAEAVHWYRRAAEAGDRSAMRHLGFLYNLGIAVKADEAESARWYGKAAAAGDAEAMYYHGQNLEWGRGLAPNRDEALHWYRKAAEAGNASAMLKMQLNAKTTAEGLEWLRKAVKAGGARAALTLGQIYADGRLVPKDEIEATRWFQTGAEMGDIGCMIHLADRYEAGRGVAKDEAEVLRWLRKAAEKGQPGGTLRLARRYAEGKGVTKDDAEAVRWVFVSIEKGFSVGQIATDMPPWPLSFRQAVQRRLRDAGVYDGPINGTLGIAVLDAIDTLVKRAHKRR